MKAIEDIILEKNYSDLSAEELNLVGELAENEDEFNEMKQLFENMTLEFSSPEMFAPALETKASLDQIFTAKHPVIANDWKKEEAVVEDDVKIVAFYNRNWVRVAAMLLLFFGISVLFIKNSDELLEEKSAVQRADNSKAEAQSETESKLNAPSQKTESAKIIYPKSKVSENNTPVYALAEDHSADDEAKYKSTDIPTKAAVMNGTPNGGISYYSTGNSGETVATYSLSATSPQPASFTTNSGFISTIDSEKDKKSNWGRLADLDPELNMSQPTASVSGGSSVSKEGLAAEMLDWIQAAY